MDAEEDPYIVRARVIEREARSIGFAPARERLIEAARRYRELAAHSSAETPAGPPEARSFNLETARRPSHGERAAA